jgi:hypothetical protein
VIQPPVQLEALPVAQPVVIPPPPYVAPVFPPRVDRN